MSSAAWLIAAAYARRGLPLLAETWRAHALALEVREQRERDRKPLDGR